MSVGSQDAVGLSSEESPGSPTVDDEALTRGTASPDDCTFGEDDEIQDADDAQRAVGSDAFCSHLYYNDDTEYIRQSPADQDYPLGSGTTGAIGSWDVVYGSYVGNYGLSTCIPWCLPGGETAYDQIHDTGAELGLTDDSQTVRENERFGWQEYAVNVLYPNGFQVAQQQTNAWEMNGFVMTQPDQQFVGFLEDTSGAPISDSDLQTIYDKHAGELSDATGAYVCGFTPDYQISINAPQASFCEVLFNWVSNDDPTEGGPLTSDDYNDPCESPAYVCGANQPAWYAQLVCAGVGTSVSNPLTGCGKSTNSYEAWHWIVAPAPSECSGDVEPGFQTTADATGAPYLAHDLDVFVPPATAADNQGTPNLEDGLENTVNSQLDEIDQTLDNTVPAAPDVQNPTPQEVSKTDRIEPNAPGDDSQTFAVDRPDTGDSCDQVRPGSEAVYDPWRNVIDNQMSFDPVEPGYDLYQNSRTNQDASNRPGYGQYYPSGYVGVFADKNDDGVYDRVDYTNKLQEINNVGAYPMIWDIHTNAQKLENGATPAEAMEGGCQPGFSDFVLTDTAKQAGYGPETGLIQIVYLEEPGYLFHWGTAETFPQLQGSTAFVSLSDAFIDYRETGVNANFVEDKVHQAIASHVPNQDPSTVNIVYTHELTNDNIQDFSAQCNSDTGGYLSQWGYSHTCGATPDSDMCADDTVVTQYVLDNDDPEGILGGDGSAIPELVVNGDSVAFPSQTTWSDVDPFDGDPDRNDETCDRPEHHTEDDDQQDRRGQQINEDERYPCGHQH